MHVTELFQDRDLLALTFVTNLVEFGPLDGLDCAHLLGRCVDCLVHLAEVAAAQCLQNLVVVDALSRGMLSHRAEASLEHI